MNNENWNNSEYTPEVDPWDRGTYQTGSTTPPKNRGGVIAVMIVMTIFITGIISFLTVMKIQIFQAAISTPTEGNSPLSIHAPEESSTLPSVSVEPSMSAEKEPTAASDDLIQVSTSPAGVANIPQEGGLSLQEIYENTISSVVSISCTLSGGTSTGTGVILSADGYIVTNAHVVDSAVTIQVILHDDRILQASLVGADTVSDLAVLWVDCSGLSPAELGDSNVLRVGDAVVAIGDPMGISLRGTMTDGIISGINRDITVDGRTMTLIQTTAALNEGNSGGPLINCYGQVIGINTMKIGDSMSAAGVEGLGFAIPSTTVQEIVSQLIGQGYVSGRPDLGIEGKSVSRLYQIYGSLPSGLYITAVDPDSDAWAKGIREGDVLMSLDGVRITDADSFTTQLYTYAVGDTATAIIYRDGRQYELQLAIGEAGA